MIFISSMASVTVHGFSKLWFFTSMTTVIMYYSLSHSVGFHLYLCLVYSSVAAYLLITFADQIIPRMNNGIDNLTCNCNGRVINR